MTAAPVRCPKGCGSRSFSAVRRGALVEDFYIPRRRDRPRRHIDDRRQRYLVPNPARSTYASAKSSWIDRMCGQANAPVYVDAARLG